MKVWQNCYLNHKTSRENFHSVWKVLKNGNFLQVTFVIYGMHVCMYVYFIFCLVVAAMMFHLSVGAMYMHTFNFISYLVLAAKMCHLLVAPTKMFHLLVGSYSFFDRGTIYVHAH